MLLCQLLLQVNIIPEVTIMEDITIREWLRGGEALVDKYSK